MGIFSGMVILFGLFSFNQASSQWHYNGSHIYNSNSGNVGIGNSAPAKLLYVGKNMTEPTAVIRNYGGSGGATFEMIDDASGADWKFKATTNGGFKIRDNANSVDVMTFLPAFGRVGIGTLTPEKKLDVFGKIRIFPQDDYPFLFLNLPSSQQSGNLGIEFQYNGTIIGYVAMLHEYNSMLLTTSQGTRNDLVIAQDGKVGIGTSTPDAMLRIDYDGNTYSRLGFGNQFANLFFHREVPDDGDGQAVLRGYRSRSAENSGTGYGEYAVNCALQGYNYYGDQYSFGTIGLTWYDNVRCGGVFGAYITGNPWGSLGYKSSGGSSYGGYFSSYTSGSGKSGPAPEIGVGIGAWGDLFGADIHGKRYGVYAEGEAYAMYSHGMTYTDNLDVHLQDNGTEERTALYTNVGTAATVQTYGTATLSGGTAIIEFDEAFASTVSSLEPVNVTVTPTGNCNGVYLSDVTGKGCRVTEVNAGKSNVSVNYFVIGKRAGYEKPALPAEVVAADYDSKLARGLHADADLQTDGEGLYYENGQLVVGKHPTILKEPDKPKEEVITKEDTHLPPGARLDEPYRGAENQE